MKKKIFISGVNSFLGKNLISKLSNDFEVFGIDKVCKESKNFKQLDLTSRELFESIPDDTDIVVNLAAVSNDNKCKENLVNCYHTNVVGLVNLMEIISKKKIPKLVHASTEWVYNNLNKKHKEEDFIDYRKFTSHYAFSKLINEQQLRMFYNAKKIKAISCLRFGIIYGHRKNNWSAMESVVNKVVKENEIEIGSKETGRHFINIEDVTRAIILSFKNEGFKIINIQGNEFITLKKLISETSIFLNKKIKIIETNKTKPSIRKMSIKKAKIEMNFESSLTTNERIRNLVKYFKTNLR